MTDLKIIVDAVAAKHGVTPAAIRASHRRTRREVAARWEAIARCWRETDANMIAIASELRMDQSSVSNAVRKAALRTTINDDSDRGVA